MTTTPTLYRSVTIGPLNGFFTNINKTMSLPGHSHTCTLTLEYEHTGAKLGPAVFQSTVEALQERFKEATRKPFRDYTNEDVATRLWDVFSDPDWYVNSPAFKQWEHPEADWRLVRLVFGVLGVPDRIGHADGLTLYTVAVAR